MTSPPEWTAENIHALRKRRGWTREEMARKFYRYMPGTRKASLASVRQYIAQWERGATRPGAGDRRILDRLHREAP